MLSSHSQKVVVLCLSLFLFYNAKGQESCEQKLDEATVLYDQGKFSDVIQLLSACADSASTSIRWKAYRLLALTYLETQQKDKALEAAAQMKLLYPRYEPDLLFDSKNFIKLLDEVNIIPQYLIGVSFSLGTVLSYPRIKVAYQPIKLSKVYTSKAGYRTGFMAGYNFTDRHAVSLLTQYSDQNFSIDLESEINKIQIDENNKFFNLTGLYSFTINPGRAFQAHALLGGYTDFLLQSVSDYKPQNESGGADLIHYNAGDRRRNWTYGMSGGVELSYGFENSRVSLTGLYSRAMRSIVDPDARYSDFKLIFDYDYLDDDIYLDNVTVSIGYIYYLSYKINP